MMKLARTFGALAFLLVACGAGGGGAGDPAPATGAAPAVAQTCVDRAGTAIACPIAVAGSSCPGNDSKDCFVQTVEQVAEAADGSCLRLVFRNTCDRTVYGQTCIEYTRSGETTWQCWTSTTIAGDLLDVSECAATGRYTHAQSESAGQLDVLASQCPHL